MRIEKGEVISEIYEDGHPANYGNSMAESSRYIHLLALNGNATDVNVDLALFRTPETYIQSASPNCPKDWLVSTDQCMPWFLAMVALKRPITAEDMRIRIQCDGWKTPDHNYVMPVFYALLNRNRFLFNLFVLLQVLIFKFPWRWDDGHKRIESTTGSSADYLNWFHCAVHCKEWIRRLVSKETVIKKITEYYLPTDGGKQEPNVQWLLSLYGEVINKAYNKRS